MNGLLTTADDNISKWSWEPNSSCNRPWLFAVVLQMLAVFLVVKDTGFLLNQDSAILLLQ